MASKPSRRGPKPKTASNTKAPRSGGALWERFDPPEDLPLEARREFERLRTALERVGTLDRTDPRLVIAAARTHALIEKASAELDRASLTLSAANGTSMPHPMLAVINSLTMRLRGLLNDMGLTPASSKLTTPQAHGEETNPWTGILNITG